ncbi:MAG: proteasome assembly chaperone family protein [Nitrosopumilaceae archaeon]|uniref:Proteasome assembly chaperone family protein n=1 Tax=Candidatus Nitrosomaritimum aestuariumsis TaxID=3342354 RepID=A0AC60VY35_9ARCH|nr:proteasome assembly chaperone family protein [Nitrosopumilaceae archaeon]MBA4461403.1 proteasome assembly chaperone family protein [Nitrosopumilaceae archaeon]
MLPDLTIKELRKFELEGGYLIDGFPSLGFSSVIATESMIHTSQFKLAGVVDSDVFPPISLIKEGKPNFPTRIFVNDELKVAAFLSHLALEESLHRQIAKKMLEWAQEQKISLIVSSVPVKADENEGEIMAVGSTKNATKKIKEAGIKNLRHGTVPGIPGILLNEGNLSNQDVIVILFPSDGTSPDFRSSARLCMIMSQLIPGASCDIPDLQKKAEKIERTIKKDVEESRHLKDTMYR